MTPELTMGGNIVPWRASGRQTSGSVGGAHTSSSRAVVRGLIVDLDDTLYPRRQYMQSGFMAVAQYVSARYGLSAEAVFTTLERSLAGGDSRYAFQALCTDHALPAADIPALIHVFREHRPVLTLDESVRSTLRRLRATGWRTVVLTNGLPSVQERKIHALGLQTLVDDVVFAEQHAATGKPAAEPFRHALARLGLSAAGCVCAGDDPVRDIAGARAVGIRTVRVTQYTQLTTTADDADAVVHTFKEVPGAAAALLEKVSFDAA